MNGNKRRHGVQDCYRGKAFTNAALGMMFDKELDIFFLGFVLELKQSHCQSRPNVSKLFTSANQ